jgi:serine protease Do
MDTKQGVEEVTMDSSYMKIGGDPRKRRVVRGGRAAIVAGVFAVGSLVGWTAGDFGASSAADVTTTPPPVERLAEGAPGSYAGIVDAVIPAVVTIRSERTVRTSGSQMPDHPFLREFFGNRGIDPVPERRQGGMGSGVIVREDGYILTNEHVVGGADQVSVELSDGRSLKAKVVGSDKASDLAVLKVEASNLRTLTLGDSDRVRVGDVVLAVGNPLGVGQTVTMGIVSAKGRATGMGDGSYEDFIQTDAPINRGNSGGALVSTNGELIGINSQIVSPSGGNIGIGFSIPANMARNVMTQLIEHGEVRRGRLGVTVQGLTSDLASGLGLSDVRGALVSDVERGGPAAAAGLQRGDVITRLNGEAVTDSNVLRNSIAELAPGTQVTLTVLRNGKEQTLTAKLGALDAARGERSTGGTPQESGRFGLSVEPLTPETARERGVSATSGVLVAEVVPGSRAADAGLRPGDVIEQVDRKPVTSVEELRSALSSGDRPAVLLVHRGASTVFVTMAR